MEHCYFFDSSQALASAVEANEVINDDGSHSIQICYYNGEPIKDSGLLNFIHVPLNHFFDFFTETLLPLPTAFQFTSSDFENDDSSIFEKEMTEGLEELKTFYLDHEDSYQDTYFLNRAIAYQTALQKNRVKLEHPTITGAQICFYDGPPIDTELKTLVNVPIDQILSFFTFSNFRLPQSIQIDVDVEQIEKQEIEQGFQNLMQERNKQCLALCETLEIQAKQTQPLAPDNNRPVRVFLPSSRMTTVMQYVTKGIVDALKKKGCEVFFSIEQNDMESKTCVNELQDYIHFRPDVYFEINHFRNKTLHDDVIGITWWQDRMPPLVEETIFDLRKKDYVLSLAPMLDELLFNCGVKNIIRQHFCINDDLFYEYKTSKRKQKIVFIGSAYRDALIGLDDEKAIIDQLFEKIEQGDSITRESLALMCEGTEIGFHYAFWKLYHYALRTLTVHWICQQSFFDVEVYGWGWEDDRVVAPFFKGELKHGEAVADVYNRATHALVVHPFEINSQRLAEVSACGCVPIIYDCRHLAEGPFWEDSLLYFKNKNELFDCFNKKPSGNVKSISDVFTYDKVAENIMNLAQGKEWVVRVNS